LSGHGFRSHQQGLSKTVEVASAARTTTPDPASRKKEATTMRRAPNSDEVRGKKDEVVGTVKEHIGRATGDTALESKGSSQRTSGNIEGNVGKARRKVTEGLDRLGDKINKS
jgi:uncharacterized protein YjbJ (UPF0337 family)